MKTLCRKCGLPVAEYKQIEQEDATVCEPCALVAEAEVDFNSGDFEIPEE